MTEYTAARAAIAFYPKLTSGFRREVEAKAGGIDVGVKVKPVWSGIRTPNIAPIAVNVAPKLDNSALAGVKAALAAIPKIELDADATPAQLKLQELRARLEALHDKIVNLDVNDAQAKMELALVRRELDALDSSTASMDVRVDAAAASAALQRVEGERSRLDGRDARLRADVDVGQAIAALSTLAAVASGLDGKSVRMSTVVDTASAVAGLAMVAARAFAIGGAVGGVAALGATVAALGPLGAIGAGGLAAVVLASSGVGKALSAMSSAQDTAGTDAQASAAKQAAAAQQVESAQRRVAQTSQASALARSDAAKNVARAEQDAARQVAQAQQSASRAVESALRQQAAAQRTLRAATADLAREQRTLTTAWEAGRRALQDLQDQVDGNALDQRQAAFDLQDATKALNEARASGDADQIARAQLAYDRQVETIDQLNKQTQRLGQDNAAAQAKGVAGSEQVVAATDRIAAAQTRVADAQRAAGEAAAAVSQARIDGAASVALAEQQGAQRVADARDQGARQVAAADQAAQEAQLALRQALQQTGDTGAASANKVASALANLSPAAAAFARYLFSLKPALDQLKASAAAGFFPPIQAGLSVLMTQLPALTKIVGLFGAAMGGALGFILTQLASPFWMQFFGTLAAVAGPILMQAAAVFMQLAGAIAQVILALLPFTPAALGVLSLVAQLVGALAPFIGQLVGALIPAAGAVVAAFFPLGPVLGALGPILAVLAQAFAQVLGAVLTALAPILVALTPLIQQLALAFAGQLVTAIQGLTPFLVGLATMLAQHPQLVLGVIGVLGGLFTGWGLIKSIVSALLSPLMLLQLAVFATGLSAAALGGKLGGLLGTLAKMFKPWALFKALVEFVGGALGRLAGGFGGLVRTILGAMGPVGWIITAFGLMYASSAPFRDAINQILGVLGQLVGMLAQAIMPIFQALAGAFTAIVGAVMPLVTSLASALVPILQLFAGVLVQLVGALLPPLMGLIGQVVPIIGMLAGIVIQLLQAWMPLIGVFGQLIAMLLPPLATILTSVVVPALGLLAQILGGVLGWVLTNVVMPALQALSWWLTNVTVPVIQWFAGIVSPVFQGIGDFISWVWNSLLKPVFDAIGLALAVLGAVIFTVLVTPFYLAWQGIAAAATWAWTNVLQPLWNGAIVPALRFLGSVFTWLWQNIVMPVWNGICAAVTWAWTNVLSPLWNGAIVPALRFVGSIFTWLWQNVVVPVWNGISGAIQAAWNFIRPIFDTLKEGVDLVGRMFQNTADWIGRAWDAIREAARKPAQWVIDVVYNRGVMPVWNSVAGLFGLGKLNPVTMATGGVLDPRAAQAGMVLPGYAPGRDRYLTALSGGEGILVPEAVRGLGPAFVGWANSTFSGGRSRGGAGTPQQAGGYARGGLVRGFADGGVLGWVGGLFSDIGAFTAKAMVDPVGAVKGLFSKVVADSDANPGGPTFGPGNGKGGFVEALQKIPGKVIDAVIKKVKDWVASMLSGGAAMGPPTAGQMAHTREIARAAQARGIPHAGAVIAVMTGLQESGVRILANPNVPASMGLFHEGVGHDHDSVGIFQQRQAGWGTLAQRMNAFASAGMFLNKLGRGPYGEYGREAQRVQVSAFPGAYSKWRGKAEGMVSGAGYAQGGILGPRLYDRGGPLLPGLTLVQNATGAAETVLSPVESRRYEHLGQFVGRGGIKVDGVNDGGSDGAQPLTGDVHFNGVTTDDAHEWMGELTHTLRRARLRSGG